MRIAALRSASSLAYKLERNACLRGRGELEGTGGDWEVVMLSPVILCQGYMFRGALKGCASLMESLRLSHAYRYKRPCVSEWLASHILCRH